MSHSQDHPRCATPTKVVMWGGVPGIVNHAKFHQNRFPERSKSAIFYSWRNETR